MKIEIDEVIYYHHQYLKDRWSNALMERAIIYVGTNIQPETRHSIFGVTLHYSEEESDIQAYLIVSDTAESVNLVIPDPNTTIGASLSTLFQPTDGKETEFRVKDPCRTWSFNDYPIHNTLVCTRIKPVSGVRHPSTFRTVGDASFHLERLKPWAFLKAEQFSLALANITDNRITLRPNASSDNLQALLNRNTGTECVE